MMMAEITELVRHRKKKNLPNEIAAVNQSQMDLLLLDRMDSIAGCNRIRVIEYTAVKEDEKPSHKQTDQDLHW